MCLIFDLYIRPKPQKKPAVGRYGVYDPSKKDKNKIISFLREHAPQYPLDGPLALLMVMFLPIPKNTSKKVRELMIKGEIFPEKRPDVDNLAYIVKNAMNTLIYRDDSQIISENNIKLYGDIPMINIKLTRMHKQILPRSIYAFEKRDLSCNCLGQCKGIS